MNEEGKQNLASALSNMDKTLSGPYNAEAEIRAIADVIRIISCHLLMENKHD